MLGSDAAELWDDVIRANRKSRVLEALQVFLDDVVDVNWIAQPDLKLHFSGSSVRRAPDDTSSRVPLVSTKEAEEAVPLSTYGEGVSRSMNILLALCTAEDGVLLIDEIENGLHHSAQRDVFNLIFQTARDLNVQVFATTHSYDALKAFEKVANEHEDEEGMLVQLRRRRVEPYDIAAVTADEEELAGALQSHVDPR
jgi:ABC-type branched-subunit amino acid transport system ATPase component